MNLPGIFSTIPSELSGLPRIVLGQKTAASAAEGIPAGPPPLPTGVVAGEVVDLSPTERVGQLQRQPTVISRVPGTASDLARLRAGREPDAPQPIHRRR